MKAKTYLVRDMQEAVSKIKSDLGNNALIISQRKVKQKGLFGFLKPELLEVIAAVESEKKVEEPNRKYKTSGQEEGIFVANVERICRELNQMRDLLGQMAKNSETINLSCSKEIELAYTELNGIRKKLQVQGVDETVITDILQKLLNNLSEAELHNENCISLAAEKELSLMMGKTEPLILRSDGKPKIIALIGPTGVGKTTTIAKLAANFALFEKKKVLLVTSDTYRIAAPEQLKTYGDIMSLSVRVVFNPQDFVKIVTDNQDKDLIILDTAGRNQKNVMHISEIKQYIDAVPDMETYLCVSMNTKKEDVEEILENFRRANIDKLIFTKIDETNTFGIALNVLFNTNRKVSYITNGQDVPDDIEVADTSKLARMLLKES